MQAGKLRVRCADCGGGAVTVDRDPQSWPDVLLPRRITVLCENQFCTNLAASDGETESQINYAQFFFKCANHTSLGEKDEAVPLYLIKPNLAKIPCLACTDVRYVTKTVINYSIKSESKNRLLAHINYFALYILMSFCLEIL